MALLIASALAANAAEHYVDPVAGAASNDGSADAPWQSVQEALGRLDPGDTLWLHGGDYGRLRIQDRRNADMVTLAAVPGEAPLFTDIEVASSRNWRLKGLHVVPSTRDRRGTHIVRINNSSQDIVIEDCAIRVAEDITGWSARDWRQRMLSGIAAAGRRIVLRGNHIWNVRHGIDIDARDSLVEHNLIENFAGDGIRGLGNHSVYQFNTIKNCYRVDDNHDDGFQSWSLDAFGRPGKGEVVGVVLRGNRIINYEDPKQPMRCTLQGIGMFDGMYVDWVIENNVVIVNHWHGITVMGGRNVRIVNNTVLDPNERKPGPPWIVVTFHKDGRPSQNSVIANNLAQPRPYSKDNQFGLPKPGVEDLRNLTVVIPRRFYVDPEAYDLHLRPGSPAIDAGDPRFAPATDIDGTPRPRGAGVDVGAYEFKD